MPLRSWPIRYCRPCWTTSEDVSDPKFGGAKRDRLSGRMTIHRPDARPFGGLGLFLDQDGVQPDVFEFQQGAKALVLRLFLGRLSVGRRETATGFGTTGFGASHAGLRTRVIGFVAFGLRSLEGWAERRAFARSVSF